MSQFDELQKAMEEWEKQDFKLLKVSETPQLLLRYKQSISTILSKMDAEKYYTFRDSKEQFGFSELMVNQLMKFAFERGVESGINQGKPIGYDTAMKEIAESWDSHIKILAI